MGPMDRARKLRLACSNSKYDRSNSLHDHKKDQQKHDNLQASLKIGLMNWLAILIMVG